MNIIEFTNLKQAESLLEKLWTAYKLMCTNLGYTIDGDTIVSKRESTGEDDPTAARTTAWCEIKESPVGTWYVVAPDLPIHRAILGRISGEEKPFPMEWRDPSHDIIKNYV